MQFSMLVKEFWKMDLWPVGRLDGLMTPEGFVVVAVLSDCGTSSDICSVLFWC
jgi:hypothetical protein